MGKILEYIVSSGEGKYICYKTRKIAIDVTDLDTLSYDDKKVSNATKSIFAETDHNRVGTVLITREMIQRSNPIFRFFLDGSRRTYKVDDIGIAKKIFPIVSGQIIIGCCERKNRSEFKKYDIKHKIILSMPDDFDDQDYKGKQSNFCRLYCEKLNEELNTLSYVKERNLKIDKMLLYKTDGKSETGEAKDNYLNRAIAKIQAEMTDNEQLMVAEMCKRNKLDDENWLMKDGSLEYNPRYSNLEPSQWNNLRANYNHVVGVSKSFDPELLPDFEGNKLSKTIADLKPFERTKAYRYHSDQNDMNYAVWYLRLRNTDFRETKFSDVVKCEMVMHEQNDLKDSDMINIISANIIREAYPVCYGKDSRWANHLYPIYLTETYCKANYLNNNIILSLF